MIQSHSFLQIFYYIYSIIGMEAFGGRIHDHFPAGTVNKSGIFPENCGNVALRNSEYVTLKYCGKNFNNVLKSFNLLFDLTVVNQWHSILSKIIVYIVNCIIGYVMLLYIMLCLLCYIMCYVVLSYAPPSQIVRLIP